MAIDRCLVVEPRTRVSSGQRKIEVAGHEESSPRAMRSMHPGRSDPRGGSAGVRRPNPQPRGLWTLALVVGCPLMLIVMMRGMHGGSSNDTGHLKNEHDEQVRRP
jgi:hypothetical protein